jgi:transcriptional regulator with XRE-family HTH domain
MGNDPRREFGRKLEALRTAKQLTRPDLMFRIYDELDGGGGPRYDASFIWRVERGEKSAPLPMIEAIVKVLQPTFEELPEAYLALTRARFDPDVTPLAEAEENFRQYAAARTGAIEDWLETAGDLTPTPAGSPPSSTSDGAGARPAPPKRRRASARRGRA